MKCSLLGCIWRVWRGIKSVCVCVWSGINYGEFIRFCIEFFFFLVILKEVGGGRLEGKRGVRIVES